jgi:putative acetyltransferase
VVIIRPERADHPQVTALLASLDQYLATLYPPEANHILGIEDLLSGDVTFLAAWDGERAVGCGAVRSVAGADGAYGEIKRMFVHPDARGQRIGEQVLQRLEASIAEKGTPRALLETGRDQHAAIRLYERFGYRRRGAFGGYPDNGLSLFYEKQL